MALQTEEWIQQIEEVLFDDANEFMRFAVNHDQFVKDLTVHVPQAGSIPGSKKNRSVFPATVIDRVDTDLIYNLDNYTTDPIRVKNLDVVQFSFDLRASIMQAHLDTLMDDMANETIFEWGSDTLVNQVRTSGASVTDNLPDGATGTRKQLTVNDIKNLAKLLDKQKVPMNDRYLLLPADMYYEIFTINDLIKADIAGMLTLPSGVANKILGFNVIKRSTTLIYNNVGTPIRKAIGANSAIDDNFGGIAWQRSKVSSALGSIEVLSREKDPLVYGDIISAEINFAAKKLRTDQAGIATLIQAA